MANIKGNMNYFLDMVDYSTSYNNCATTGELKELVMRQL